MYVVRVYLAMSTTHPYILNTPHTIFLLGCENGGKHTI